MNRTDKLLEMCDRLDTIGNTIIRLRNIEPYIVNMNISAKRDCLKARRYYAKRMNVQDMEMHHTQDGYIVPVPREVHRASHIGGVKLFGLKR